MQNDRPKSVPLTEYSNPLVSVFNIHLRFDSERFTESKISIIKGIEIFILSVPFENSLNDRRVHRVTTCQYMKRDFYQDVYTI